VKTKACESRAYERRSDVRKYTAPFALTPSERVLLDALVEHGGVTKVAEALGLKMRSISFRMRVIREKIGATSSKHAIEIAKGATR
jgi:DNA-binding CsgD family transcriptional regulator